MIVSFSLFPLGVPARLAPAASSAGIAGPGHSSIKREWAWSRMAAAGPSFRSRPRTVRPAGIRTRLVRNIRRTLSSAVEARKFADASASAARDATALHSECFPRFSTGVSAKLSLSRPQGTWNFFESWSSVQAVAARAKASAPRSPMGFFERSSSKRQHGWSCPFGSF